MRESGRMGDDIALYCTDLSKHYHVHTDDGYRVIHALEGLDLEIRKGECLGIIGRNGCGKSTLVKMIAGILKPTRGMIRVGGRIHAITEVGSGFLPDLTGLENIRLHGKVYGLSREDIVTVVELVSAFSGLADVLGQPVKNYSQGMFLRLAFSTIIHMPLDILLFDEVLAVGDISFRAKCYGKLRELSASGHTIIMVSHSYEELATFCQTGLLLEKGHAVLHGRLDAVYSKFLDIDSSVRQSNTCVIDTLKVMDASFVSITGISIRSVGKDESFIDTSTPFEIVIEWDKLESEHMIAIHLTIADYLGQSILDTANYYGRPRSELEKTDVGVKGAFQDSFTFPASFFNCGRYLYRISVTAFKTQKDSRVVIESERGVPFIVHDSDVRETEAMWTVSGAAIRMKSDWKRAYLGYPNTASIDDTNIDMIDVIKN